MIEVLKKLGFRPRACVWELTLACNLSCKHCGSAAGKARKRELSLDESYRVAEELVALGCQRVTLGGGEPTLNPHWPEITRRLTDLGARVNMISNGWVWSEEHIERAKACGLKNIAFSLDGFEREHDTFRRKGSFRRVVDALDACARHGYLAAINTTVNTLNRHGLPEFRDFLAAHRVFSWQVQIGTPSGNLAQHPELVIPPEDMLWLVPQLAKMRLDKSAPSLLPGDDIGYYGRFEQALRDRGGDIPFWIGCRAGCQVIGIESDGGIKGCLSLPSAACGEDRFVEGNVREQSLAEIWNRSGSFAYNREPGHRPLGGFCAVCRHHELCRGGCTWTAYSYSRDRFEDPYCLYQQAVKHRRYDLLEEEPLAEEVAYFG